MKLSRLLFLLAFILLPFSVKAQKPQRFIAVTIDDLPVVSTRKDLKTRQEITDKILAQVTKAKVPAIGFVNENKLYDGERRDEAQVDLLRRWIAAGLELGNHTYSHLSLNGNSLEKYEAEILRGELITKQLLADDGGKPIRYFRHPYLMTGKSLAVKEKLAEFLRRHDYTIAPVTFDNDDYFFARALDTANDRGDEATARRVLAAYVPYMESKADYWERQSLKTFGREIKQILLIHANSINAEKLGELFEMLESRGYKFITLEDALTDEAYRLPDEFIGNAGISWLHRWTLAKNSKDILPGEPATPVFVMDEVERKLNE